MAAQSHCDTPACAAMNVPLDCQGCFLTVAADLSGMLLFDGSVRPFVSDPSSKVGT